MYINKEKYKPENVAFIKKIKQYIIEFVKIENIANNVLFYDYDKLISFLNSKDLAKKVWYSGADWDAICYTSLTFDGIMWPVIAINDINEIMGIELH